MKLIRSAAIAAALLCSVNAGAQALHDIVTKGSTDRSVTVKIIDATTGVPSTDIVFNSSGIDLWYRREGAVSVDVTEATLAALTTAHTDGGFLHVNDGVYRLDLPDAAFATGANYVDFGGTVTGEIVIGGRVKLVNANLEDGVRLGLTSLPNAAAEAAGGLYTHGTGAGQINQPANGRIDTGVVAWNGTALGTTNPLPNAAPNAAGGLLTFGSGSGQINPSGGAMPVSGTVTVGTNNDKSGYSLTQTFPTNFADLSITATTGRVTLADTANNCVPALGCGAQGTLNGTHSGTTADLGTNAPASTVEVVGKTFDVPGKLSRVIRAYDSGTGVITFAPSTALTLSNGDQWYLWDTPPSPTPTQDVYDTLPLTCTVNTANFAGSTTTAACLLTDIYGAAVTAADDAYSGKEFCVTSGAQYRECRFIGGPPAQGSNWDGVNGELQITFTRAWRATLADSVTAIIR